MTIHKHMSKKMRQSVKPRKSKLPPDPEGMNDRRAAWADSALASFSADTGSGRDEAIGDLICNLIHWCDRNNFDFDSVLVRARNYYIEETTDQKEI